MGPRAYAYVRSTVHVCVDLRLDAHHDIDIDFDVHAWIFTVCKVGRKIVIEYSKFFESNLLISNTDQSGETNPNKFLLHPLLSAEPDLNPTTNGA